MKMRALQDRVLICSLALALSACLRPQGTGTGSLPIKQPQANFVDGSSLNGLLLATNGPETYAVGADRAGCHAWRTDHEAPDQWTPVAAWSDCKKFLVIDRVSPPVLILVGETTSRVVRIGTWVEVPSSGAALATAFDVSNVRLLLPRKGRTTGGGFAFQEVADGNHNGAFREWMLFVQDERGGVKLLQLPGAEGPHFGFERFGDGSFAVLDHSPASDQATWRFVRQAEDGQWTVQPPVEMNGPVIDLVNTKPGHAARVQSPAGETGWWIRQDDGTWKPASVVFPDFPTKIEAIAARGSLLVLTGATVPSSDQPAIEKYYHRMEGEHPRALDSLSPLFADSRAASSFLGDRGLALLLRKNPKDDAREWKYFLHDKAAGWRDIQSVFAWAPGAIWDAADFAGAEGIGLQERGDSNGDGRPFDWSWRLQDVDGKWSDARLALGFGNTLIANMESDDEDTIAVDIDGKDSPRWFIRNDRTWSPLPVLPGVSNVQNVFVAHASDPKRGSIIVAQGPKVARWLYRAPSGRLSLVSQLRLTPSGDPDPARSPSPRGR